MDRDTFSKQSQYVISRILEELKPSSMAPKYRIRWYICNSGANTREPMNQIPRSHIFAYCEREVDFNSGRIRPLYCRYNDIPSVHQRHRHDVSQTLSYRPPNVFAATKLHSAVPFKHLISLFTLQLLLSRLQASLSLHNLYSRSHLRPC